MSIKHLSSSAFNVEIAFLMTHDNEEIQNESLRILMNLVRFDRLNAALLEENKVFDVLSIALDHEQYSMVADTLAILCNLCQGQMGQGLDESLCKHGILEKILHLTKDCLQDDVDLAVLAIRTLQQWLTALEQSCVETGLSDQVFQDIKQLCIEFSH